MKFCIALVVVGALAVAVASAAPPRPQQQQQQQMMYFQQRAGAQRRSGQQAMLVHRYAAPKHASRRSAQQESGAFASGDSIEGATFIQGGCRKSILRDCSTRSGLLLNTNNCNDLRSDLSMHR